MSKILLIFTVLPLLLTFVNSEQLCSKIPPALWCENKEIATKCGVLEKCQQYQKATAGKKLQLTLFFESLCPDCQEFIKGPLKNLIENFGDLVEIEWVPFGNAKLANGTIVCQHKEPECAGNRFESCVIENFANPFGFIYCFEEKFSKTTPVEDAAKKCYDELKVDGDVQNKINECYKSDHGRELQLQAAKRTYEGVWPEQHKHVPHLLFNNVSVNAIQSAINEISGLVCSWLGEGRPAKCDF